MTLREAVYKVMSEAKGELHYKEVWDRIERRRLFATDAPTPWQTVGSYLYKDPTTYRKTRSAYFEFAGSHRAGPPRSVTRHPSRGRSGGTLLDAILRVLSDAERDLHYREIWDQIASRRLFVTDAPTPWQTVGSYLYKRKDLFQQTDAGTFRLTRGAERGPSVARPTARQYGEAADWRQFEVHGAELMKRMGLGEVEVTRATGDRGIDVWGKHTIGSGNTLRVGMQTKYWRVARVTPHQLREFRGSMEHDDLGIFVTEGKCTAEGYREASLPRKPKVVLIDGDELHRLQKMTASELEKWAKDHLG